MMDKLIGGELGANHSVAYHLMLQQRPIESIQHLRGIESIHWATLVVHLLHRTDGLVESLRLLHQIRVENWYAPSFDVILGQRVDHQYNPKRLLAFPVARDGIEQMRGIAVARLLCFGEPRRQLVSNVVDVILQTTIQFIWYDIGQPFVCRQQLAVSQRYHSGWIGQVQLEDDAITSFESSLRLCRDMIPDLRVGHMNGAKQKRWWR